MSLGPAQKAELIDAIYTKFGVPAAAEHCHLPIRAVLDAVDEDDEFAAEVEKAVIHLTPLAEQEMFRRAIHGVENHVVSQGRLVMVTDDEGFARPLVERKYSDSLLVKFLESRNRGVYGPKVEVAHKHSGYIAVPVMDASQLQALMNAPGDEVEFLDGEYEVLASGAPRQITEKAVEADYPSSEDTEEHGLVLEDEWDIL